MSRERTFGLLGALLSFYAGIVTGQWALGHSEVRPTPETELQTRSDPAPIFRCIGAGGGVVVSLGGDGKSVFLYCDEVNP